MFSVDTFDVVFKNICREVMQAPDFVCSPRDQLINERLVETFCLNDPTKRLINNPARAANYGFAVGEFLWYWQGRCDLEMMLYYNKRMKNFSDDGKTLESAYGFRLRKDVRDGSGNSQWDDTEQTLLADSDSRRAVMTIYSPADMRRAVSVGTKDVPCTLSLQFFVRDGELHLHSLMRSNDVMWGLTYDAFSFTLLQECMLLTLKKHEKFKDLRLGRYYHTAGSMHIYSQHFGMASDIARKNLGQWAYDGMPHLDGLESLTELCRDEELLRTKKIQAIDLGKYQGGERWMSAALNDHASKRYFEELGSK